MFYRLGELPLQPSDAFAALRSVAMRGRGEDWPDLFGASDLDDRGRAWAESVHDALTELLATGRRLELLACSWRGAPERAFECVVLDRTFQADVRPGDRVFAGMAVHGRTDESVAVWSRLYRVTCANGQVITRADSERTAHTRETIGYGVEETLSQRVFDEHVERLKTSARTPLPRTVDLVQLLGHFADARAVREAWERERDQTAWGLINAITSDARRIRSLPRRLRQERLTGRVLDRLDELAEIRTDAPVLA